MEVTQEKSLRQLIRHYNTVALPLLEKLEALLKTDTKPAPGPKKKTTKKDAD